MDDAFGLRVSDTPEFELRAVDVLALELIVVEGPGVEFGDVTSPLGTVEGPGVGFDDATSPLEAVKGPGVGLDDEISPLGVVKGPGVGFDDTTSPLEATKGLGVGFDDVTSPLGAVEGPGVGFDDATLLGAVDVPGFGFDDATTPLGAVDVPGLGLVFTGVLVSEGRMPCVAGTVGVCGTRVFVGVGFGPLSVGVLIAVDHINFALPSAQRYTETYEGSEQDWLESQ